MKGIGGGSGTERMLNTAGLVIFCSCFQGRWVEEFALATEAGTSLAAWCVDSRTWHGFSEEVDDVAPPSRDHVRLLGSFRFVLGGAQRAVEATPLAHELQLIWHGLCIATSGPQRFSLLPNVSTGTSGVIQFGVARACSPLRTVQKEVQTSLRRVQRYLIHGSLIRPPDVCIGSRARLVGGAGVLSV